MPQTITTSVQDLLAAANAEIEILSLDEAKALHGRNDVVFVDLRDVGELKREGKMAKGESNHDKSSHAIRRDYRIHRRCSRFPASRGGGKRRARAQCWHTQLPARRGDTA